MTEPLEMRLIYLEQSGIGCKKFQRRHPEPILASFQFFYLFYHRPNFYFYWPIIMSKSDNSVTPTRVSKSLEPSVFAWNDQVSAAKSSKECTPNHFWEILIFFTYFATDQTFTFTGRPFCPNLHIWTLPPLQVQPSP